jgi:predicted secreted hydrolase
VSESNQQVERVTAYMLHTRSVDKGETAARWLLPGVLSTLLILLASCTGPGAAQFAGANVVEALSNTNTDGFERAYEPIEFVFPQDHGAHPDFQTEWWYFTGNLGNEAGERYGYQLTFFRSAANAGSPDRQSNLAANQIYMAHFAVTDESSTKHHSFERYSRGAGDLAGASGEPAFEVWLEDWSVQEIDPGRFEMKATASSDEGPVAINFVLTETQPAILHGDSGLSQKSAEPGNASYYYSLVGLETSGTITTPSKSAEVSGLSWMDHEFGTSSLSEDALGWDWFSIQLDNGAQLMFAQIRKADGGVIGEFEGTLVLPDGSQESLASSDFDLTVLDQWTSSYSGATYPSGWALSIPNHDIDLKVEPLIEDQEMQVSYVYWEGAVDADGTMMGEAVSGSGYVELTGTAVKN